MDIQSLLVLLGIAIVAGIFGVIVITAFSSTKTTTTVEIKFVKKEDNSEEL